MIQYHSSSEDDWCRWLVGILKGREPFIYLLPCECSTCQLAIATVATTTNCIPVDLWGKEEEKANGWVATTNCNYLNIPRNIHMKVARLRTWRKQPKKGSSAVSSTSSILIVHGHSSSIEGNRFVRARKKSRLYVKYSESVGEQKYNVNCKTQLKFTLFFRFILSWLTTSPSW